MKNYSKIFKIIMLALIVISVAICVAGFVMGFESKQGLPVEALLYWTYGMVALAIISIVVIGIAIRAKTDVKSLGKIGIVLAATLVICAIVYFVSPASPAVGMLEQPDESTLKLTTFILNLTYICGGAAIVAIIVGEIHNSRINRR